MGLIGERELIVTGVRQYQHRGNKHLQFPERWSSRCVRMSPIFVALTLFSYFIVSENYAVFQDVGVLEDNKRYPCLQCFALPCNGRKERSLSPGDMDEKLCCKKCLFVRGESLGCRGNLIWTSFVACSVGPERCDVTSASKSILFWKLNELRNPLHSPLNVIDSVNQKKNCQVIFFFFSFLSRSGVV